MKNSNKPGRNSTGVSLDVASALKARKSEIEDNNQEEKKSGKIKKRFNVAMTLPDYQRFVFLKSKLIEKNIIYSLPKLFDDSLKQFESNNILEGLEPGQKLSFPEGRKMGYSPADEKEEKKGSSVDLLMDTYELLERYITKRIKEDNSIGKSDIFHELLNVVFEKYDIQE